MAANDVEHAQGEVAVRTDTPASEAALARTEKKLAEFRELADGWDSYDAPSPSPSSIERARAFAHCLSKRGIDPFPSPVPSVVGGVGYTFYRGEDRAVIEFDNEGDVTIAFSQLKGGERQYAVEEIAWDDANAGRSSMESLEIILRTLHD